MKGVSRRRAVTIPLCLILAVVISLGAATAASAGAPGPPLELGPINPAVLQELQGLGIDLGLLVGDPIVEDVEPNGGLVSGGNEVVITGTDFTGATKVTFGGTDAEDFNVDSDTQITATAPLHAAGTVQVQVTTPQGASPDTTADDYTYVAAPPTTAPPTTAPPTTAAPTTQPPTTELVTTTLVADDGGGLSSGWIAFIAVIAVLALGALSYMVYMLGKRNTKGGPTE